MDTSLPKEFMLLLFIFAILSKNLAQSVYENHNTSESYFGMRQFRDDLAKIQRQLNSAPTFISPLATLNVINCKSLSYLLPQVNDNEKDDYDITATLNDGSPLPSWISFNSRMFKIKAPKEINEGSYEIKVRITDSTEMYTDYSLQINLSNPTLALNNIQNVTLISPQQYSFTFKDVLKNQENYDLSSNIKLNDISDKPLPNWIREFNPQYNCLINNTFNPKITVELDLKFSVADYCGDLHFTDAFKLTIKENQPPIANYKPDKFIFYKGQQTAKIHTPTDIFIDPGDTLMIAIGNCFKGQSEFVKTSYNATRNYIMIQYSKSFIGDCTFPVVAKDSVDNLSGIMINITISECNQLECTVCSGAKMSDCTECKDHHILNLKTGECIPILSIYSLGSIKLIGIFLFFYLLLHFMIVSALNMFTENKIKSNISKSIISMIQTILLISHFDNNISGVWRTFTDGFQYFKFEFRFLNPVFFIVSTMNNKESSIPNRMYDLFFENKTAAICFCNFLVIVFLIIRIKVSTFVDVSFQFYTLCLISEIKYSLSWLTSISITVFIAMILCKYIYLYIDVKLVERKNKIKKCIIEVYNDFRKVSLCLLFFIDNHCYLLILLPIVLQTLSLVICCFCNDFKQRITKLIVLSNEFITIIFCILMIFTYNCFILFSQTGVKVVGITMEIILLCVLVVEITVIFLQDIISLKNLICTHQKIKVNPYNSENSKKNDKAANRGFKKSSSLNDVIQLNKKKQRPSICDIALKKDVSMKVDDVSLSMHDLCNNNKLKEEINLFWPKIKCNNVEENKLQYSNGEIEESDIIPKISIVKYDTISSKTPQKSICITTPLRCRENKSKISKLHVNEITPKSLRNDKNKSSLSVSGSNKKHVQTPIKFNPVLLTKRRDIIITKRKLIDEGLKF